MCAVTRRPLPRRLPRGAVAEGGEYDARSGTVFLVKGQLVAIERELYFDENGHTHVPEREYPPRLWPGRHERRVLAASRSARRPTATNGTRGDRAAVIAGDVGELRRS
jgi:hypothetical protein